MSEGSTVRATPAPRTRDSLAADLRLLGLVDGMTVIVHSSLKSLGWVVGGSVAVVQALMDVVTPGGTLVMPTQTTDNSDPEPWGDPPVPADWWPIIRDTMPAFDPRITPTRGMGRIVETFRTWPGVLRSNHPALSFAAWGAHAEWVTAGQSLDYGLGENSPLARIYDLDGSVLLLGVGYDRCTSFHLAEYRIPHREEQEQGAAILTSEGREWRRYRDIQMDSGVFPSIGDAFEGTGMVRIGAVGSAQARLFPQQPAVDFAMEWLRASDGAAQSREPSSR